MNNPGYDVNGNIISVQNFDPWGNIRTGSGTISQTDVNYPGQVKDGSGLLYYHARYYGTFLGRFVSPDSIVPGTAMGKGGALTVDFHEPAIINNQEKFKGGPTNPQNLNRYSYVLDNPLKTINPSGHDEESEAYLAGGGYPMTEGGGGEVIGSEATGESA